MVLVLVFTVAVAVLVLVAASEATSKEEKQRRALSCSMFGYLMLHSTCRSFRIQTLLTESKQELSKEATATQSVVIQAKLARIVVGTGVTRIPSTVVLLQYQRLVRMSTAMQLTAGPAQHPEAHSRSAETGAGSVAKIA